MANEDFDRDEFEAWLKTQPRDVCVAIAARAALRDLPLLSGVLQHEDALDSAETIVLPLLRAVSSSWVAIVHPEHDAAAVADKSTVLSAADVAARTALDRFNGIDAVIATGDYPETASTKRFLAHAGSAGAARIAYSRDGHFSFANTDASDALQSDRNFLAHGKTVIDLMRLPLWHGGDPPNALANHYAHFVRALLALDQDWDVWTGWYEDRIYGRDEIEELEIARVLLPEEIWKDGPAAVNAEIRRLIEEHEPETALLNQHDPVHESNGNGSEPPVIPPQKDAPAQFVDENGLIAPSVAVPDDAETLDPGLTSFHEGLRTRTDTLNTAIGDNHPGIRAAVTAYRESLGGELAETKVVLLGMAGIDLERLLEEYTSGDPDSPDLLPEPKAALRALVSLHLLFIRQFNEWNRFFTAGPAQIIAEEKAGAVEGALAIAVERTLDHPEAFSPETPRLIQGIKSVYASPGKATKTSLYWAMRTLENLLLKIATKAYSALVTFADKTLSSSVEKGAVVASGAVLFYVGNYLLNSFGTLPAEWSWLKPAMDFIRQNLPEMAKGPK